MRERAMKKQAMKKRAMIRRATNGRARRFCARCDSGFTLVEMLVAVAAVGLISVGLAQLFKRTGDTLKIGRKVAALNEVAGVMERTMREDFQRMSREGFLVIKHRYAVAGSDTQKVKIALTKDELPNDLDSSANTPGRVRRVDEVVFFTKGTAATARDPVYPGVVATGTAARIYYGHGLQQTRDFAGNPAAYTPEADDTNDDTFPARAPSFGQDGPNKYAADWILLRHQTALIPPRLTASANRPIGVTTGPTNGRWADSRVQIGLQPAAADVFRYVAAGLPLNSNPAVVPNVSQTVRGAVDSSVRLPKFGSGIIDIAATDLTSIRARVLNAQYLGQTNLASMNAITEPVPGGAGTRAAPFALQRLTFGTSPDPYELLEALRPGEAVTYPIQDPRQINLPYTDKQPVTPTVSRMKRWMMEAFPADPYPETEPQRERRMRCEAAPPDLIGTVSGAPYTGNEEFRRSDQMMLSASNFIVGCTEFIVEWSFGATYPTTRGTNVPANPLLRGQLIWHGLPRLADLNHDGTTAPDEYVAHPYTSDEPGLRTSANEFWVDQAQIYPAYNADLHPFEAFNAAGASVGVDVARFFRPNGLQKSPWHVFETALFHEPTTDSQNWRYPTVNPNDAQMTRLFSCFGYVDPTFAYHPPATGVGSAGSSEHDRATRPDEPTSVACPWPKLIRVTVSLVEPSDPLSEQTYQFIFRVPDAQDASPAF